MGYFTWSEICCFTYEPWATCFISKTNIHPDARYHWTNYKYINAIKKNGPIQSNVLTDLTINCNIFCPEFSIASDHKQKQFIATYILCNRAHISNCSRSWLTFRYSDRLHLNLARSLKHMVANSSINHLKHKNKNEHLLAKNIQYKWNKNNYLMENISIFWAKKLPTTL